MLFTIAKTIRQIENDYPQENDMHLFSSCVLPENGRIFIIGGSNGADRVIREARAHDGHYDIAIINDNMGFAFEFGRCVHNEHTGKSYVCFDVHDEGICRSSTDIESKNGAFPNILHSNKNHYGGDLVVHNGKLTAIGGSLYDNKDGAVEVFSESTSRWDASTIPALGRKLTLFTALSIEDALYIFGGIEWKGNPRSRRYRDPPNDHVPGLALAGTKWRQSKAVLKLSNGQWVLMEDLKEPKYFHRSIIWNEQLFHVGGCIKITKTRCGRTHCIKPSSCEVRLVCIISWDRYFNVGIISVLENLLHH